MEFISIKNVTISTNEYPHNTSLGITKNGQLKVLGDIPHGSIVTLDKENALKLIEVLNQIVKG